MTRALTRVHIRNLKDLLHYILTGAGQTLTSSVDETRDVEGEGKCSALELSEQFLKERDEVGCESQHNSLLPAFTRLALPPTAPASQPASPSAIPISSLWHTILSLETHNPLQHGLLPYLPTAGTYSLSRQFISLGTG